MDIVFFLTVILGLACPLAWLIKDEVKFRLVGAAIPFSWAVLNYAQGLIDSSLILFVISLRALTGLYLMRHNLKTKTVFASIFLVFFTAMLFKGYEDAYSLLPWFAACLTTLVQIYLSGIALRVTQSFGADGAWIVYDFARSAWGHLFEKSVSVLFNLWTIRGMLAEQKLLPNTEAVATPADLETTRAGVLKAN